MTSVPNAAESERCLPRAATLRRSTDTRATSPSRANRMVFIRKPMKIAGMISESFAPMRSSPSTSSTACSVACQVSAFAPMENRLATSASAMKPNRASVKTSANTPKLNFCETATITAISAATTMIGLQPAPPPRVQLGGKLGHRDELQAQLGS